MKLDRERYDEIKAKIRELDATSVQAHKNALASEGFSNERFRWDLFWAVEKALSFRNSLYSGGLNDNHYDTALRRVVKELNL